GVVLLVQGLVYQHPLLRVEGGQHAFALHPVARQRGPHHEEDEQGEANGFEDLTANAAVRAGGVPVYMPVAVVNDLNKLHVYDYLKYDTGATRPISLLYTYQA